MELVRTSPHGYRHPLRYGVERHPRNEHRLLLHFDDDAPMELDAHSCLCLIEMLSQFVRGCIVSESEMVAGRASRRAQVDG